MYVCGHVNVVSKAPELKKRLKDLVRQREDTAAETALSSHSSKDRLMGEFAMDIGTSTHWLTSVPLTLTELYE